MNNKVNMRNFCCVDDFPILIPYKDLENLLQLARNLDSIQLRIERTEEQLEAVRSMYTEALDKIAEIRRIL